MKMILLTIYISKEHGILNSEQCISLQKNLGGDSYEKIYAFSTCTGAYAWFFGT